VCSAPRTAPGCWHLPFSLTVSLTSRPESGSSVGPTLLTVYSIPRPISHRRRQRRHATVSVLHLQNVVFSPPINCQVTNCRPKPAPLGARETRAVPSWFTLRAKAHLNSANSLKSKWLRSSRLTEKAKTNDPMAETRDCKRWLRLGPLAPYV